VLNSLLLALSNFPVEEKKSPGPLSKPLLLSERGGGHSGLQMAARVARRRPVAALNVCNCLRDVSTLFIVWQFSYYSQVAPQRGSPEIELL